MIWNRKQFKKLGKTAFLKNFGFAVAVCFLVAFIAGEAADSVKFIIQYDETRQAAVDTVESVSKITNEKAIGDMLESLRNRYFPEDSESGSQTGSEFGYGDISAETPDSSAQGEAGSGTGDLSDDTTNNRNGNLESSQNSSSDTDDKEHDTREMMQELNDSLFTTLVEELTNNNSLLARAYEANHEFLISHKVQVVIAIGIGSLVLCFFQIFIANGLIVGKRRFFLENRIEKGYKTPLTALLYTFNRKDYWNTVYIMFVRNIFQFLWAFTVIGGIIKLYQYRFIPSILAENPQISRKEAFRLTKQMTKGYKWKLFIFDCSFIPWKILESLTLGIAGVFFVEPYKMAAETEAYVAVRESFGEICLQTEGMERKVILPKIYADWTYYSCKEKEIVDYARWYGLTNYVIFFFLFAILGWVWKVALHFVQTGELVNRGVLCGPWLPIYGTGALIVLIFLRKLFDRPLLTFVLTMIAASVVEYFTSWVLELIMGVRWWDYSGYFLNINGRICIAGAVIFGIGGILVVYLIAPLMYKVVEKIGLSVKIILCTVLIILFIIDEVRSFRSPNIGKGITATEVTIEERYNYRMNKGASDYDEKNIYVSVQQW